MKKILLSFVGLLVFSVFVSGDTFFPKVPLLDRISTITAGDNVTVTQSGSTYTISASTGTPIDGTQIAASTTTLNATKVSKSGDIMTGALAGTNVTVSSVTLTSGAVSSSLVTDGNGSLIINSGDTRLCVNADAENDPSIQLNRTNTLGSYRDWRIKNADGTFSVDTSSDSFVDVNVTTCAVISARNMSGSINVGIMTDSPSERLTVVGNIRNIGYGLATSSITFSDGTVITSSSTLGGTATSIAANAITAGTMDADVIASSVAVGAIGPENIQDGKNYNLSTASMTLSQLTLAGGGTATGITGDIPEISTVTYARINTIQFNDGTVINSSSTLGGTTESIAASAITAGTLGADVIASSIAVASVQNEMITAVGADKINAGTLGASVIASSIAVNAVRAESIKDISLDATYLVLGGTKTAGTNAVRISKFFPSAITISTITVTCVGGTGGAFNIEERTVPATAGTDVWSSDVTVSTTAWCGGAMGNDGIAADAALYLVPTSWNGAVLAVEIKGKATRD